MTISGNGDRKPVVALIGADGNVFNIIGLTIRALKKAGLTAEAAEFKEKAFRMGSYDAVLRLVMEYCDVE